jgi:hypothetical protein
VVDPLLVVPMNEAVQGRLGELVDDRLLRWLLGPEVLSTLVRAAIADARISGEGR